jgi:prepilin signal peptidase PulO-like enzyme (type II secretory pathway)
MSPIFCLATSLWTRSLSGGGLVLNSVNISLIDLQHMVLLFFILIPYLLLGLLKVVELLRGLLKLSVGVPPDGEERR